MELFLPIFPHYHCNCCQVRAFIRDQVIIKGEPDHLVRAKESRAVEFFSLIQVPASFDYSPSGKGR
jgi:hypothetical protein